VSSENASSRHSIRPSRKFIVLVSLCILVIANWLYGGFRFSVPQANLLFIAVAAFLPIAALIHFPEFRPRVLRIPALGLFALCAVASCTLTQFAAVAWWNRKELLYSRDIGSERIFVYQTLGGATTGNGFDLSQEWTILPGLQWVRPLIRLYPADHFTLDVLSDRTIMVTHPQVEYEGELRGGRTYTIEHNHLFLPKRPPN